MLPWIVLRACTSRLVEHAGCEVKVVCVTRDEARKRAWMLYRDLQKIANRDPDQEVQGIAVPVLDACLQAFREHATGDPVVVAIDGLMSPKTIADGCLRAVDAALVVGQLAVAIGPENPPAAAPVFNLDAPQAGLFTTRQQF